MSTPKRIPCEISLDRVFLHHENPRHEPYKTQAEVIQWLCTNEQVLQLARDIAQHGLSPLDRFGVRRDHDTGDDDATFIVAEGNRRVCALKLLTDPELAPADKREYFEGQAEKWTPITELPCVIFDDEDDLNLWLKRRHHGLAGGIGQKPWNADQKARHSGGSSRNRVALAFLDYAEQQGHISAEDRKGKLTTVQRFLGNPKMRKTFGLDISDPDNLNRTRTAADFGLLTRQFVDDMLSGDPKVHSRRNKAHIEAYALELSSVEGLTDERVEPEPLASDPQNQKPKPKPRPAKPKKPQWLPWDSNISKKLDELGVSKLKSLYYSICNVRLRDHTPLVAVGIWSFFETLTVVAGRNPQTNFHSFLSKDRLANRYGLGPKEKINPLRDALARFLHFGNATKHHDTAAAYNADQMVNDMESLSPLIVSVIEDAIAQK